jgi:hypothetical protein
MKAVTARIKQHPMFQKGTPENLTATALFNQHIGFVHHRYGIECRRYKKRPTDDDRQQVLAYCWWQFWRRSGDDGKSIFGMLNVSVKSGLLKIIEKEQALYNRLLVSDEPHPVTGRLATIDLLDHREDPSHLVDTRDQYAEVVKVIRRGDRAYLKWYDNGRLVGKVPPRGTPAGLCRTSYMNKRNAILARIRDEAYELRIVVAE